MKQVYGWLQLTDGTEIDLDGQTLEEAKRQINGRSIRTYKHPDLGDESNVMVGSQVLTSLQKVRKVFA